MKAKIALLMVASVLAVFLAISLVSATVTITGAPANIAQTSGTFSFPLNLTSDVTTTTATSLSIASITSGTNSIVFTPSITSIPAGNLVASTVYPITVTYTIPSAFEFSLGRSYSTSLILKDPANVTLGSQAISVAETKYCASDINNDAGLAVKIEGFDIISGFGEDDDYMYPNDEVEFTINVEPKTYDMDNIEVEWALYSKDGEEIMSDTESDFDLEQNDDKDVIISVKIDPNDLTAGVNDYVLYVKATGDGNGQIKGDDKDSAAAGDGVSSCASTSKNVEIVTDDEFMIIEDLKAFPENATCGSEVEITGTIWNIWDDDQADVSVTVINTELGVNEKVLIGDIDSFDSADFSYKIKLSDRVLAKTYPVKLIIENEDGETLQNKDDVEAEFEVKVAVEGTCAPTQSVTISPYEIVSAGKVGGKLVVTVPISNSGADLTNYKLNAAAYTEWAESATIDKPTLSLGAGQSGEVTITFNVKSGIEAGEYFFNMEVTSPGTTFAKVQPVGVNIEKSSFSLQSTFGDKWYLWVIGAVNVVLIIIIIAVALKVSKGSD
jgi:uncharacterized membrane protein